MRVDSLAGGVTSQLTLSPLPAPSEVFRIADIPSDRIDEIEETCRTLFYEARMGAIARPEYLSRGDGLATSFAQVERGTFDAWSLLAPSLREVRGSLTQSGR